VVITQVLNRFVKIIDVKRYVMSANVAIARLRIVGFGRFVLEDLKDGLPTASVEAQFAHDREWINIEVHGHPVIVTMEWAEAVQVFAPDDVDKPGMGLLKVGHSEADVV
jgi:hypothetical protein